MVCDWSWRVRFGDSRVSPERWRGGLRQLAVGVLRSVTPAGWMATASLGFLLAACDVPALEPLDGEEPPPVSSDLPAPAQLDVEVASGTVTLRWSAVDGAAGYVVYRARGDAGFARLATLEDTLFVDTSMAVGVPIAYGVAARDADGGEGPSVDRAGVVAGYYGIEIESGSVATRTPRVQVAPIAPPAATVVAMALGASREEAAAADPVPFGDSRGWALAGDDGFKEIYGVLYTDKGVRSEVLETGIYLDRVAEIEGVDWCVEREGEGCVHPDTVYADLGEVVLFRVLTGEDLLPAAQVVVQIGAFVDEQITLTDVDGDGLYEGRLNTALTKIRTSESTGQVTAFLTDAAGNEATPAQAPEPIIIR